MYFLRQYPGGIRRGHSPGTGTPNELDLRSADCELGEAHPYLPFVWLEGLCAGKGVNTGVACMMSWVGTSPLQCTRGPSGPLLCTRGPSGVRLGWAWEGLAAGHEEALRGEGGALAAAPRQCQQWALPQQHLQRLWMRLGRPRGPLLRDGRAPPSDQALHKSPRSG